MNIYTSIIGAPKYINKILRGQKVEIDNTIIAGYFNTTLFNNA